jgi:hypothetical protein
MAALLSQTLITPSCGTGSIPPDAAQKVLSLTRETASVLRDEFL